MTLDLSDQENIHIGFFSFFKDLEAFIHVRRPTKRFCCSIRCPRAVMPLLAGMLEPLRLRLRTALEDSGMEWSTHEDIRWNTARILRRSSIIRDCGRGISWARTRPDFFCPGMFLGASLCRPSSKTSDTASWES